MLAELSSYVATQILTSVICSGFLVTSLYISPGSVWDKSEFPQRYTSQQSFQCEYIGITDHTDSKLYCMSLQQSGVMSQDVF
jgi:hypothetical protein